MVKKLKTFALFLLIYFFIIPIKASEKKNLIAHAGGEIDSYIYTNSYEAVMKSIKNGYKYIEIDLRKTTDNIIVGIHSWADLENILKKTTPNKQKEFFKNKILSQNFTYKDIQELNKYLNFKIIDEFLIEEIFSNDESLILVTDKIQDYKKLANTFTFHDRIIIEVIGLENYLKSFFYNFKKNYLSTDLDLIDRLFISIFRVKGIVVNKDIVKNSAKKNYLENYINNGGDVFMYTINDHKLIREITGKTATHLYTDKTY